MSTEGLPRFTDAEMARRLAAVRELAATQGVDALLVFGHSGSRRHYQADIHYLTEVAPYHEAYLLVPVTGEPVFWTTHNNHFASARECSRLPDVRRAPKDAVPTLAREFMARGFGRANLGVVGPVFHQEMDGLRAQLPEARWKDLSHAYKMLRVYKSAEELDWQRKAAAGCDRVMAALADAMRPGIEERELLVLSEQVAWQDGCAPNFLYLNSTPMAASESCVPNQNLSRRKLQAGDVVNTELTVGYGMYSAQLLRPFFLGEPTPEYAKLYETTKTIHDRLQAAMKPGVTTQALYDMSLWIREQGYITVDGVMHGFGVDIQPPAISSQFIVPKPFTLAENVTIVLQPQVATVGERAGVQLGQMGLITAEGYESMHASPSEVTICG